MTAIESVKILDIHKPNSQNDFPTSGSQEPYEYTINSF
jgi:hypothetical protein